MSCKVREWLKRLGLLAETEHEDRVEIDREIERRKGVNCDEAVEKGMVTESEFLEIVNMILLKKKKKILMEIVV